MIGNNSSGSHSIVYGTTIDHVARARGRALRRLAARRSGRSSEAERARRAQADTLEGAIYRELPAILRDHARAIAEDYPKHWRQSGGYRLDRARPRVRPRQARRRLRGHAGGDHRGDGRAGRAAEGAAMFAVGHFESRATRRSPRPRTRSTLEPAAVEMIDRTILELSRSKLEYAQMAEPARGRPGRAAVRHVLRRHEAEVARELDRLEAAWREHGHGYHTLRAETAAEQAALTKVRKAGLGLLMAASEGAPAARGVRRGHRGRRPSGSATTSSAFRAILDRHGLEAGFYGHCSVGCLHIRPFVDLTQPGGVETMRAVAERGRRRWWRSSTASTPASTATAASAARSTRACSATSSTRRCARSSALFDPDGRLNPGVMVDAAPMTAHLRDPALPPAPPLRTPLRVRRGRDARAPPTAASASAPAARPASGVMCPSYMATREEEHATRGRANALVKALSRAGPARRAGRRAAARDPRPLPRVQGVQERVPAERRHGDDEGRVPLALPGAARHRRCARGCSARSGALNRLGAATAPLSQPARCRAALLERAAGIDRRAAAPALRARDAAALGPRARAAARGSRGDVVFLADSFTTFTEPAIGRAAIELLEAAGWRRPAGERRLLRALEHLQGAARPGARDGRGDGRRGSRRRPSAACRSSAASRRAC